MKHVKALLAGGLALALGAACSEDADRVGSGKVSEPESLASASAAAKATPAPAQAAVPVVAPERPDARPTIGKLFGKITGPLSLESGSKLPPDQSVVLPAGTSLEFHFPGGASVRVLGPASMAVPAGELGLLVGQGTVSVNLELAALHPDSGFWLATPGARIELVHGGRFVLRVFQDRSSELTAVSGILALTPGGNESEPALKLASGARAIVSADGRAEVVRQVSSREPRQAATQGQGRAPVIHLQTEERRLLGLPERSGGKGSSRAPSWQSRVEAACDEVVKSVTRERELQVRHRALLAQKDPQAMQLQRELAQQGGQTFNARRGLEKSLSLLEAESLAQASEGLSSPLIARARELLR